jgi:hypothetical protein
VHFPRIEDSSSYLAEIYCETAEYDEHQRSVKYTHPETQPDDALHAINYAAILGRRNFDVANFYGSPESGLDIDPDGYADSEGFWGHN